MPTNYLTGVAPPNQIASPSSQMFTKPLTDAAGNVLTPPAGIDDRIRAADRVAGRNYVVLLSPQDRAFVDAYNAKYHKPSTISNIAGGILAAVGTAVGGPVWTVMNGVANYGNQALHPNETNSSSDLGKYGAIGSAIGGIYNMAGGPGSYSAANQGSTSSTQENTHAGTIGGSIGNSGGNMAGNWDTWINLGGQLLGSYLQSQGSKNAANASAAGLQAGINEQARQFDTTRADQMPWLQSGAAALGRLNDPNSFTQSPGYNFVRSEGNRGIENSFAANGGVQSGNALRALDQYNQNLASQEYNNWWNQQANLAGLGQSSAQNLAGVGQNNANNVSNLLSQQGNARASGIEGQTNALTGGIGDFLKWYNNRRTMGG